MNEGAVLLVIIAVIILIGTAGIFIGKIVKKIFPHTQLRYNIVFAILVLLGILLLLLPNKVLIGC